MSNKERKSIATGLKEAEEFFEQEGLSEVINQFFESERFNELMEDVYGKLFLQIQKIQANVPETLKEQALNIWAEAKYDVEQLKSDVKGNMQLNLHMTIGTLKEFVQEICTKEMLIKSIIQNNYAGLMHDAQVISADISEKLPALYLENIYAENLPTEVEEILKLFGGRGIIVISAVPKEVMDDLKEKENASAEDEDSN